MPFVPTSFFLLVITAFNLLTMASNLVASCYLKSFVTHLTCTNLNRLLDILCRKLPVFQGHQGTPCRNDLEAVNRRMCGELQVTWRHTVVQCRSTMASTLIAKGT